MPKLRHYDHLNTSRFVTFCCYRRNRLLVKASVIKLFLSSLDDMRRDHAIRLLAYVIMPEHVHLVVHPPDSIKLGPVIGALKSKSASMIISSDLIALPDNCTISKNGRLRRAFWQPRFYDHNCRTHETVVEKINYCDMNPVKRGLVAEPGDWRWSSYNWYGGDRDVPLRMDETEVLRA